MMNSVKSGNDRDAGDPDFAEPVIGPAERRTRWLNPGYSLALMQRAAAALAYPAVGHRRIEPHQLGFELFVDQQQGF
jgi:hypothetical protein